MLFIAECFLEGQVSDEEHLATQAWLGPMVDEGMLEAGWIDFEKRWVWMALSAPDRDVVDQRLRNLPVAAGRKARFAITPVHALRFR